MICFAISQAIRWQFISKLLDVQEQSQLKAANKLSSRHINYQQKIMNVKLCVQLLSNKVATAIDACRKMQIDGFEDSEATTEFIRVTNMTFDMLNSRPYAKGPRAPLSMKNKVYWESFIVSAIKYFTELTVIEKGEFVPLYKTQSGTFVRGLVTALTTIQQIMERIETRDIELE